MHVELYKGAQVEVVDLEGQYTVDKLEMTHVVVCSEVEALKVERWRLTVVDGEVPLTGELLDIVTLPDQEEYFVYWAFSKGELTALEGAKRIGEIEARKKTIELGKLPTQ